MLIESILGVGLIVPGLAIAGAVAVSVPIGIHLLSRLRRKKWYWGAMRFLEQAIKKQRRRMLIEQWLLLTLRCLIVVLVGVAMAGLTVDRNWLMSFIGQDQGREVHLVFDTSLSGHIIDQTQNSEAISRLEQSKRVANHILKSLDRNDQIIIWGMGKPSGLLWDSSENSTPSASEYIQKISANQSAHDLAHVLESIDEYQGDKTQVNNLEKNIFVLSGFSRADDYLSKDTNSTANNKNKYFVTTPLKGAANYQISNVNLDTNWLLDDQSGGQRVGVEIELTRFVDFSNENGLLNIEAHDKQGNIVGKNHKDIIWQSNEDEKRINTSVLIEQIDQLNNQNQYAIAVNYISTSYDALPTDNQMTRLVEVSNRIHIGLLYDELDDQSKQSADWLTLALNPFRDVESNTIQINELADLQKKQDLDRIDLLIVLGEAGSDDKSWKYIDAWLEENSKALWFVPVDREEQGLQNRFVNRNKVKSTQNTSETWLIDHNYLGSALKKNLSADWKGLTKTIKINHINNIKNDKDDEVWAQLNSGDPIIFSKKYRKSEIVLWNIGLNDSWSNLTTKPLFIALIQETFRSINRKYSEQKFNQFIDGEVEISSTTSWNNSKNHKQNKIFVDTNQSLWIQNHASIAGNTNQIDNKEFEAFWDKQGHWQLIDWNQSNNASFFQNEKMDLSWYLLLCVLALLITEMWLSRRMSYALDESKKTLSSHIFDWYGKLQDKDNAKQSSNTFKSVDKQKRGDG
ncbi:BatA domain-containing protein [Planctomycetota bacterium]|nr:BatA domain-containing protein [Planctomycetota bacterium]